MKEPDDLSIDVLEQYPTLVLAARFAKFIPQTAWFHRVGEPLSANILNKAQTYLDALGLPHITPAFLDEWQVAVDCLTSEDDTSPFQDIEQQLTATLTTDIMQSFDPELTQMIIKHITDVASQTINAGIHSAANRWGITDDTLLKTALDEGVKSCYQAALVIIAGMDDDHPFVLKYQLFETGHWPVGIIGSSFNIF